MFARLAALFAAPRPGREPASLKLAAAALLVEAAVLDGRFDPAERAAIDTVLRRRFSLSPEESEELIAEATSHQDRATDLFTLTRHLAKAYNLPQRIELIEMIYEVVYADGALHDHEASMMRRLGELIAVSDRDRAAARQRVLAKGTR